MFSYFSSIDLSNITAAVYSTDLSNRLTGFLAAWPPSSPLPHVNELLIATADFERNLESWNIRFVDEASIYWEKKKCCQLRIVKAANFLIYKTSKPSL